MKKLNEKVLKKVVGGTLYNDIAIYSNLYKPGDDEYKPGDDQLIYFIKPGDDE